MNEMMVRLVSCGVGECKQAIIDLEERKTKNKGNIEQNTYTLKTRLISWYARENAGELRTRFAFWLTDNDLSYS